VKEIFGARSRPAAAGLRSDDRAAIVPARNRATLSLLLRANPRQGTACGLPRDWCASAEHALCRALGYAASEYVVLADEARDRAVDLERIPSTHWWRRRSCLISQTGCPAHLRRARRRLVPIQALWSRSRNNQNQREATRLPSLVLEVLDHMEFSADLVLEVLHPA